MGWTARAMVLCAAGAMATAAAAQERPVLRYMPKHEELKYTYGGHRAGPPHRAGNAHHHVDRGLLRRRRHEAGDSSRPRSSPPGHENPQTGPFYVEGAVPGDTLAIHIEKLEPARDYGISSPLPGLRRAERNRPHRDPPAGPARDGLVRTKSIARRTWPARSRPTASTPGRCRSLRSSAASACRRRTARRARPSCPTTSGATWIARKSAPATRSTSACGSPERSSPSATATTRRATARSSARPSRAR